MYIPCVVLVTVTASTATVANGIRYAERLLPLGGTLGTATSGDNNYATTDYDPDRVQTDIILSEYHRSSTQKISSKFTLNLTRYLAPKQTNK